MKTTKKTNESSEGLVGHYFHTFDDKGMVERQGFVSAKAEPGLYLVQFLSWICGDWTNERLIRVDEMMAWNFYATDKDMRFAFEYGCVSGKRSVS
jgi:hypothetical protein